MCLRNLKIWNLNLKFFELFAENIADVSIPESPPPPCQQVSAFMIPLPPSKMLTYFMDGPLG